VSDTTQLLQEVCAWRAAGRAAALVTVISTWGSSPRPVGAKLLVDDAGQTLGSVSAGCVEGAVIEAAREVIASGVPRRLEFGVPDDEAWSIGLACGGKIALFAERIGDTQAFTQLLGYTAAGRNAALVTDLASGRRCVVGPGEHGGDLELAQATLAAVREVIASGGSCALNDSLLFVDVLSPPLRLLVIGAVHVAQALVPMARLAGYDVIVIDPREAFASAERFPDTRLVVDWPEDALPALRPDARTAIVTLSHNARIDEAALAVALRTEAFFVGALGSRRTHAARCERLREAGFGPDELARLRGPVGLAIGALTPAEIAISVLAEMTAALRRAPLGARAPA
jgi:xanthine dehydrogenase accessory factor